MTAGFLSADCSDGAFILETKTRGASDAGATKTVPRKKHLSCKSSFSVIVEQYLSWVVGFKTSRLEFQKEISWTSHVELQIFGQKQKKNPNILPVETQPDTKTVSSPNT